MNRASGRRSSPRCRSSIFGAKARRYPSAVAAALAPNAIPVGVYKTLVAEANAGLPVVKRYFEDPPADAGACPTHGLLRHLSSEVTKLDRKFDIAETQVAWCWTR